MALLQEFSKFFVTETHTHTHTHYTHTHTGPITLPLRKRGVIKHEELLVSYDVISAFAACTCTPDKVLEINVEMGNEEKNT